MTNLQPSLVPSDILRKPADQLTKQEAAAILLERRKMRSEDGLPLFIARVFETVDPVSTYKHNWHIDLISEYLMACYRRDVRKLIINMPPRFMKSISVSVAFPAWLLGRDPSEQIMCASYSGNLSQKHSVDCRTVIESLWYKGVFPDVALARDQNAKNKFMTTKRGHRIATSVGGSATGDGGNFLICDDPLNPLEAASEADRTTANEWFDQTWSTRKNDPKTSVEIMVMQRLHVSDTTGHALAEEGWEHLIIPHEAEEHTTVMFPSGREFVREKGDLLHPDRIGEEEAANIQRRLGTYGYAGQYQQRPAPLGGGRVKLAWFPTYRELPEFEEIVLSADTAQKPKEINDPSVIQVYGRKDVQWYLIDEWKDQVAYPTLKTKMYAMSTKWNPDAILIEDKSSGSSLIQEIKENREKKLPVIAIEPEADKVTRFDTQTPSLENGTIALPDASKYDHPWLDGLLLNLSEFPNPQAWDELDAMSQFLKWLKTRVAKRRRFAVI